MVALASSSKSAGNGTLVLAFGFGGRGEASEPSNLAATRASRRLIRRIRWTSARSSPTMVAAPKGDLISRSPAFDVRERIRDKVFYSLAVVARCAVGRARHYRCLRRPTRRGALYERMASAKGSANILSPSRAA